MAEQGEKQEFRVYRSKSGSVYQEPLNNSLKPFIQWRRNTTNREQEDLLKARYIPLKEAKRIITQYGTRKKAIKEIFDKNNGIDCSELEGVVLFIKADKRLYFSSPIEKIEPGFEGLKVMEKPKDFNIDEFVGEIDKVEPDIEEDDGTLDMTQVEPKYKTEPTKLETKPQYKPELIKSGTKPKPKSQSEYKPKPQPALKPVSKPAPKPKSGLRK